MQQNININYTSAQYSEIVDKKSVRNANVVSVRHNDKTKDYITCSADTYGKMWLEQLEEFLSLLLEFEHDRGITLRLISGQGTCATLARTIERIYIDVRNNSAVTEEAIAKIVHVDSKRKTLPNDLHKVRVMLGLLVLKQANPCFQLEVVNHTSPETARVFNLAKKQIHPDYVVPTKPKRSFIR